MHDKLLAYITENKLFAKEDKILLAVSGGIDSVVMVRLFSEAGLDFAVAHCNFGLRGEESDADEKFVRKLARKAKANCYVKHFETEDFARDQQMSIQMAARELRYNWFEELVLSEGYDCIALAHHQNDQLETMLLNLTRGTGIAGLHGIAPKRGRFIRPLLFATKEDIFAYVTENQVIWREDSSNASTKYQRNKIRHEVIPLLEELNPNLSGTSRQTAEKIGAVERFFYQEADKLKQRILSVQEPDRIIDLHALLEVSEPALFLSEIAEHWGFSYPQAREIISVARQEGTVSGKIFNSPTHRLNVDRGRLVISPKNLQEYHSLELEDEDTTIEYAGRRFEFKTRTEINYKIKNNPDLAALDKGKLQYPLKIRKWKAGDWFCPLGMNKKKKLSDFMIDEKIPLNLKERVLVLISGDSVVWIPGHRIDNRYKITDKTTEVLEVKVTTHD